jgi:hypothetical protein
MAGPPSAAFAGVVRWLQSGYIYHYAFAMLLGIFVLMTYFVSWPSPSALAGEKEKWVC